MVISKPLSTVLCCLIFSLIASSAVAQDAKATVAAFIDENATAYGEIAQQIWDLAEVGYLETQSSALLRQELADAGFEISTGVAGIPTAFIASWSASPGPVIGILAEYDALPGISQDRNPLRLPIDHKAAGHARGHHLFGTGGMNAATWVPGTSSHSWQAMAAGGTSIGNKGMIVAAKTLAMTAVDLLTNPALIESAQAEHEERIPEGWEYVPLLGDRAPPLDREIKKRYKYRG